MKKTIFVTTLLLSSLVSKAQVKSADFKSADVNQYQTWSLDYKRKVFESPGTMLKDPSQIIALLKLGLQDTDNKVRFSAAANTVYFFSGMQVAKQKAIQWPYTLSDKNFQSIQETLINNINYPDENVRIASVKALLVSDARSKKIESLLLGKFLTDPSSEVKREIIEGMLRVGYDSPEFVKMTQTLEIGTWNSNQPSFPTQSLVTPD